MDYIVKTSQIKIHITHFGNRSLGFIFKAIWGVGWKSYWILSFPLKALCEKWKREKEFTEMN